MTAFGDRQGVLVQIVFDGAKVDHDLWDWVLPSAACFKKQNRDLDKYLPGWWFGHPSEKYEFVNWDD